MRMINSQSFASAMALCAALVGGCASPPGATPAKLTLETQRIFSREFHIGDTKVAMRALIATFQDLGFLIDTANADYGSLTGTRKVDGMFIRMTVTIRAQGDGGVLVAPTISHGWEVLDDEALYEQFFAAYASATPSASRAAN